MADFHHQDNKDIASGDSIRKILVVDNDASTAELIRDNMAPDGFIVDAVSADDNSFSINLAQYKLVFINLGEETESGLTLLEQIKQLDDGKKNCRHSLLGAHGSRYHNRRAFGRSRRLPYQTVFSARDACTHQFRAPPPLKKTRVCHRGCVIMDHPDIISAVSK